MNTCTEEMQRSANIRLPHSHVVDPCLHLDFIILMYLYFRLIMYSLGPLGGNREMVTSPLCFALCACFYWPSDCAHCGSVFFRALLMIYCTLWESSLKGQLYKPSQASGIYFYQTEQLLLRKKETLTFQAACGWPRLVRTPMTSVQLKWCDSPFNSRLWEAHVIIMHLLCQRSRQRWFCLYSLPAADLFLPSLFHQIPFILLVLFRNKGDFVELPLWFIFLGLGR